jgi:hypothetical protein
MPGEVLLRAADEAIKRLADFFYDQYIVWRFWIRAEFD